MSDANALTAKLLIEIPARFPNIRVWCNNRVDAMLPGFNGRMRRVQAGIDGQADISGIVGPSGKRLELEVKCGKDRQSLEQIAFERMIRERGGVYVLVAYQRDNGGMTMDGVVKWTLEMLADL